MSTEEKKETGKSDERRAQLEEQEARVAQAQQSQQSQQADSSVEEKPAFRVAEASK